MAPRTSSAPVHIVIIGASGHARVIADIVRCSGDVVDGFLDDREADQFPNLNILGCIDDAKKIAQDSSVVSFIIGIGGNGTREMIANRLGDIHYYTAIHPTAVIASDATIGVGSVIMANAVVNAGTVIGSHCIINTGATVDHDCMIADYVHISPGAHVSGTVEIGKGTWISVGACVVNNVSVCPGCVIGAGAVVLKSIDVTGTYVGTPARMLSKTIYNRGGGIPPI